METSKLVINGIIYIIITSFFVWLLIKEKEIGAKIKVYRDKFSTFVIELFKVKGEGTQKSIRKTIDWTETIGSAIILVLIIQHFYIGNFLVPTGSMIPTIMPKDRLFGNMVIYNFVKPSRGDVLVFKEPAKNRFLYTKRLIGLPGEQIRIGEDNRIYINGTKLEGKKFKTKVNTDGSEVLKDRDYYRGGLLLENEIRIPKKGDTYQMVTVENRFDVSEKKSKTFIYDIIHSKNITNAEEIELLYDLLNKGYIKFILNGKEETSFIYDLINNPYTREKLEKGETINLDENYYYALGDNSGNSLDSRYWGFVAEHRIKGQPFVRFWPLNRIGLVK